MPTGYSPINSTNAVFPCSSHSTRSFWRRTPSLSARGRSPSRPYRSLAYFTPVIDELLAADPDPDYFLYLRHKLQRLLAQR